MKRTIAAEQEESKTLADHRENDDDEDAWSENEDDAHHVSPPDATTALSAPLLSLICSILTTRRGIQTSAIVVVSIVVISHIFGAISYSKSAKQSGAQPYDITAHKILPRRVITVFGLESSGTTFLYRALSKALNATVVIPDLSARAADDSVEIQHISQPWGLYGTSTGGYATIDIVPPLGCASFYDRSEAPVSEEKCMRETGLDASYKYPLRFFVNIASHVEWYRSKGVDCTAIIMTRDYSTHLEGKKKHMLWPIFWERVADAEDKYGRELMVEAMAILDHSTSPGEYQELVIASYETLMFLRKEYLFKLYEQLGIDSDYVPTFHDGNAKYFRGGGRY